MPPTRHRYRCIRQIAGDERSRARGKASQGQIADSSDNQSHQGIARRPRRHRRDHPRDMLSAAASTPPGRRYTAARIPCQEVSMRHTIILSLLVILNPALWRTNWDGSIFRRAHGFTPSRALFTSFIFMFAYLLRSLMSVV